ncbi:stage II sporulation protein M [Kitasatospora sp. NPDC056800]|uniref:stage II sporulation protein M n=1 Tax=Kitasatospora sp. NPDC056800 TaxID=3345948 RepID=UPI0036844E5E
MIAGVRGGLAAAWARQRWAVAAGQLLWFACMAIGIACSGGIESAVRVEPKPAGPGLWLEVFLNNAKVAALAFSGVATLGLTTVAFSLLSGLGVGVLIGHAYTLGGSQLLRAVGPHAVLELPALGLAVAAGLAPVLGLSRRLVSGRGAPFSQHVVDAAVLFGTSLAALAVAAGVETWVSPR